jgi:hypothetical protein
LKTKASLQQAAFAISLVVVPVNPRAANSDAAVAMMPAWRSCPDAFREVFGRRFVIVW